METIAEFKHGALLGFLVGCAWVYWFWFTFADARVPAIILLACTIVGALIELAIKATLEEA